MERYKDGNWEVGLDWYWSEASYDALTLWLSFGWRGLIGEEIWLEQG